MIPTGEHPGAFGTRRKFDIHTGVDLYVPEHEPVFAVETGHVVAIENYTGPEADSPWWLDTKAILIEGESGVVCYGEVAPKDIGIGQLIDRGSQIAHVIPVLQEGKKRNDIPGHSRFMLHFELYEHGTTKSVWWKPNQDKPTNLLDPTQLLFESLKND